MPETYKHIELYFNLLRIALLDYTSMIASSEVNYETRTKDEGTISGSIKFIDGSIFLMFLRPHQFYK